MGSSRIRSRTAGTRGSYGRGETWDAKLQEEPDGTQDKVNF